MCAVEVLGKKRGHICWCGRKTPGGRNGWDQKRCSTCNKNGSADFDFPKKMKRKESQPSLSFRPVSPAFFPSSCRIAWLDSPLREFVVWWGKMLGPPLALSQSPHRRLLDGLPQLCWDHKHSLRTQNVSQAIPPPTSHSPALTPVSSGISPLSIHTPRAASHVGHTSSCWEQQAQGLYLLEQAVPWSALGAGEVLAPIWLKGSGWERLGLCGGASRAARVELHWPGPELSSASGSPRQLDHRRQALASRCPVLKTGPLPDQVTES